MVYRVSCCHAAAWFLILIFFLACWLDPVEGCWFLTGEVQLPLGQSCSLRGVVVHYQLVRLNAEALGGIYPGKNGTRDVFINTPLCLLEPSCHETLNPLQKSVCHWMGLTPKEHEVNQAKALTKHQAYPDGKANALWTRWSVAWPDPGLPDPAHVLGPRGLKFLLADRSSLAKWTECAPKILLFVPPAEISIDSPFGSGQQDRQTIARLFCRDVNSFGSCGFAALSKPTLNLSTVESYFLFIDS